METLIIGQDSVRAHPDALLRLSLRLRSVSAGINWAHLDRSLMIPIVAHRLGQALNDHVAQFLLVR